MEEVSDWWSNEAARRCKVWQEYAQTEARETERLRMRIKEIQASRDFWEDQYEELLSQIGGTSPR